MICFSCDSAFYAGDQNIFPDNFFCWKLLALSTDESPAGFHKRAVNLQANNVCMQ